MPFERTPISYPPIRTIETGMRQPNPGGVSRFAGNIGTQKLLSTNMGEIVLAEASIDSSESCSWGCTFSVVADANVPAGNLFDVEGRIKFGAGGINVDSGFFPILRQAISSAAVKGLSVNIPGANIRVSARIINADPGDNINVGAFLSRNPIMRPSPIQISVTEPAPLGSSNLIPIPPFAKTFSVFQSSDPFNGGVNVQDGLALIYGTEFAPSEKLIRYPTAGGQFIEIINNGGLDSSITIVFDLEF